MKKAVIHLVAALSAAFALFSCSAIDLNVAPVFYGQTGNFSESKAYIGSDYMVYWHESDLLSVFRSSTNERYAFDGATGDDYGTFTKNDETVTGTLYSCNYALYPYNSSAACASDGSLSFSIPATQTYALNSPDADANIMVAATSNVEDYEFRFRNACAYLMLKITGDVSIKQIVLSGNNDEIISGDASAKIIYKNAPVISMDPEGGKTITLNCSPAVELSSTPTQFWIALPQTTFTGGFTISVTTSSEGWFTKQTLKNITFSRNSIQPMKTFNIAKSEIDNQLELPVEEGELEW